MNYSLSRLNRDLSMEALAGRYHHPTRAARVGPRFAPVLILRGLRRIGESSTLFLELEFWPGELHV